MHDADRHQFAVSVEPDGALEGDQGPSAGVDDPIQSTQITDRYAADRDLLCDHIICWLRGRQWSRRSGLPADALESIVNGSLTRLVLRPFGIPGLPSRRIIRKRIAGIPGASIEADRLESRPGTKSLNSEVMRLAVRDSEDEQWDGVPIAAARGRLHGPSLHLGIITLQSFRERCRRILSGPKASQTGKEACRHGHRPIRWTVRFIAVRTVVHDLVSLLCRSCAGEHDGDRILAGQGQRDRSLGAFTILGGREGEGALAIRDFSLG